MLLNALNLLLIFSSRLVNRYNINLVDGFYENDVEIHEKIQERIKQKARNKSLITYGAIFVGVIGVAAAVSYLLFKPDKKN